MMLLDCGCCGGARMWYGRTCQGCGCSCLCDECGDDAALCRGCRADALERARLGQEDKS